MSQDYDLVCHFHDPSSSLSVVLFVYVIAFIRFSVNALLANPSRYCSMYQYFISFCWWVILHYRYTCIVHPSVMNIWVISGFGLRVWDLVHLLLFYAVNSFRFIHVFSSCVFIHSVLDLRLWIWHLFFLLEILFWVFFKEIQLMAKITVFIYLKVSLFHFVFYKNYLSIGCARP